MKKKKKENLFQLQTECEIKFHAKVFSLIFLVDFLSDFSAHPNYLYLKHEED